MRLRPVPLREHQDRLPRLPVPGPVGNLDPAHQLGVVLEQVAVADLEADQLTDERVGPGKLTRSNAGRFRQRSRTPDMEKVARGRRERDDAVQSGGAAHAQS